MLRLAQLHSVRDRWPYGVHLGNPGIRIIYKGGGTKKDTKRAVPENERGYPEPTMFGDMPAYGFYCRHVRGLEFHNVKVSFAGKDLRPALIREDVEGLELDSFKAERARKVFWGTVREMET